MGKIPELPADTDVRGIRDHLNRMARELNRVSNLTVATPLELYSGPGGDMLRLVAGGIDPGSIAQFSRTASITIDDPISGRSRKRITYSTDVPATGGIQFNPRVTLEDGSGTPADQGIMTPQDGTYLVSIGGIIDLQRDSQATGNPAPTAATPIVVTAASHGMSDGQAIWMRGVDGNEAANGYHLVANKTSSTFELYDTAGFGTPTNGNFVQLPEIGQNTVITLRKKPSGGSFADYLCSQYVIDFPVIDATDHPSHTFSIPNIAVVVEDGDTFEVSVDISAGDGDVIINSSTGGGTTDGPLQHIIWQWIG